MRANDKQVGGTHYSGEVQHWDLCAEIFGPGYFKAQATRYMCRWHEKDGIEALRKTVHYLEKLIEVCAVMEAAEPGMPPMWNDDAAIVDDFFNEHGTNTEDATIIRGILQAEWPDQLAAVISKINKLIAVQIEELPHHNFD